MNELNKVLQQHKLWKSKDPNMYVCDLFQEQVIGSHLKQSLLVMFNKTQENLGLKAIRLSSWSFWTPILGPCGPIWTHLDLLRPNCPIWTHLVPLEKFRPICIHMDLF